MKSSFKIRASLLVFCSYIIFSCGKGSKDSESSSKTVSKKLENFTEKIAPNALRSSSSENLLLGGDPCANFKSPDRFRNFLACQPTLLANYISQTKAFVEGVTGFLKQAESQISSIADGASGSLTSSEGYKISYTKTDSDTFTVKVSAQNQTLVALSIDNKKTDFQMDAWVLADKSVYSSNYGRYSGNLDYQNENSWSVTLFLAGIPCDSQAVDSPERIELIVSYSNGVWTGKAMSYHPRKSGDLCTQASPDASKMNVYTDFIGDETATKASVYMLNHTVSSLESITTFQIGKFCVNYPSICGTSTDYTTDSSSSITLPFCVSQTGKEPVWGNSCPDSSNIVNANYSAASQWVIPSTFYLKDLPTVQ